MENIYQLVKKAEQNLIHGKPIKIGKYAEHDHVEKISTIDAYLNSQHISGKTDSIGREKPFFNIILGAVYTWFKATDIDRKNISFKPANSKQRLKALVATIMLQRWMSKKNFGQWLNDWGFGLAKYGSIVSKFVERDGKLIPSIISWDRLICDPVRFDSGLKIEKLYFTPSELRKQPYDPDKIEEAIQKFQESRTSIDGMKIDVKNEYIGLYEVHGEMPLSFLTGNPEDKDEYRQQMHVLFMADNPKEKQSRFEVTLYSGKESKDPYYISHLIEQEGRTLAMGAVEALFDAQWMVNHSMKQVKDQMDLASKMVTQTSDPAFLGRNIATEIDTGSVLIHKENQPLTQVNLQSHDIPNTLGIVNQWKEGGKEIASTFEAVTGQQPPPGTPFRLQAMLSQEARGLFLLMRQNKGLHLEEMLRKYILPYFKKTLNNSDEVIAVLDGEELEKFDDLALPARLSQELLARLQGDHIPTSDELMGALEQQNSELGHTRILKPSDNEKKTWKEYFSNIDMDAVEIEITGESRDKQAIVQNLFSIFQNMMAAPQMFDPQDIKKVFNKILDEIGMGVLSPIQLKGASPNMEATGGQPTQPDMGSVDPGKVGVPQLTI